MCEVFKFGKIRHFSAPRSRGTQFGDFRPHAWEGVELEQEEREGGGAFPPPLLSSGEEGEVA